MSKKAQEALDDAVQQFIREAGWDDSGLITSWVAVVHQHSYDNDGDSVSSYSLLLMGGDQAEHVSEGLLRRGIYMVGSTPEQVRYPNENSGD